jgi:hypothetical protein
MSDKPLTQHCAACLGHDYIGRPCRGVAARSLRDIHRATTGAPTDPDISPSYDFRGAGRGVMLRRSGEATVPQRYRFVPAEPEEHDAYMEPDPNGDWVRATTGLDVDAFLTALTKRGELSPEWREGIEYARLKLDAARPADPGYVLVEAEELERLRRIETAARTHICDDPRGQGHRDGDCDLEAALQGEVMP